LPNNEHLSSGGNCGRVRPVRGIQLCFGIGAGLPAAEGDAAGAPNLVRAVMLPVVRGARQRLWELGLAGLEARVRVLWNPRMRSTAGRAIWPQALIELNPALQEIGMGEVERTLLHELAHLVAYERAGRRRILPHGVEWQKACGELGIPGEPASHRLDLPTRQMRRRWAYVCPHCEVEVARVRRMRGGLACWPCCRRYSRGEYDRRFKFIERKLIE
jgi:SprT protein